MGGVGEVVGFPLDMSGLFQDGQLMGTQSEPSRSNRALRCGELTALSQSHKHGIQTRGQKTKGRGGQEDVSGK